MDLKARIAAFESGTPLAPPESPTSPPRPSPSSLEEITRTSIEAARRRAGSSASASSSNGGSAGWGDAPVGLGLGQIKPSAVRRIPSSGSSVGGRAPQPPPQVTLNGGREGDIPLTRTSPKVTSSSIISFYPSSPSSPIQPPRTSSSSHAPSIRPIEPSRSPSPSNSFTTSSSNGRPAIVSSNSTSNVPLNDFSARLRPSALRSNNSSSTTSLPNFNSSSSSTPSSNPSLLRKPPPPPAPQNLGLPMPKSPPPPSPTTPKPHRSQSARGPTLSLQTATPEGSPDPNSDMITFSPINHPSRAGSGGSGAAGPSPIRRSTIPLSSPSSSSRALPPPLPSRPTQPNAALKPSPSKHRPTLSTSSFQSVELEGSENEKEPDDSSSLATPIASRGPSFSSPISTPNLSRTSSTSSMKPPPLPQRKPTLPPANTNDQPSSPITYAPRVRRVPPPPPNQPTQPPLILSARPPPQNTSRGPPSLPPKPSNLLSPSSAAQPTQASLARYNSLFTKLVALRRVAAMQALMSAPSTARASTESKPGWKRASFVASGSEGGEEEKKGLGGGERLEGKVVRLVWERSRLNAVVLKGVWDRVENPRGTGSLDREAFVKGMGEIDEELRRARLRSRGGGSVGSGRGAGRR